jgi:succinate-semialdehyde dehydrogenase / glutarate-semialdehyde dehydrogenase
MNGATPSSLWRSQAFIEGRWCAAESGGVQEIRNPSTGAVIGTVPAMAESETQRAIAAAEQAFGSWRQVPARERAVILRRWYELILSHQDELAGILTTEQGKPLAEARGEVAYAASYVEWFAEEGKRAYGDTMPASQADRRIFVLRQPIGVCAAITPWNFPAAMVTRKIAPALAAGCTVVLKPAPQTPFTALALADLAQQAGLPGGAFNVVTGDAQAIGAVLARDPVVRKLSFTGSTAVGRLLMRQCADTVKKLSLELGGNAPFIVFDDADVDAAVAGCIATKFRNGGQTCVSANRIYAQAGIHDAFSTRLCAAVAKLRVGDGFAEVDIGPLVNEAAIIKVERHVEDAVAKGGRLLLGGRRHPLGGNFFEPTILSHCLPAMSLSVEETFGPVAPLFSFRTEAEVVRMANDTESGLAAYLFGRDLDRVWRTAEALEFGIVGVNTGVISAEQAPFGGVKQSGLGREGSRYGLDEYLEMKYLCLGLSPAAPGKPNA